MGSRRLATVRVRLALHCVTQLDISLADATRQLSVSTLGIAKAATRAERS